jgi:hypothetical protein
MKQVFIAILLLHFALLVAQNTDREISVSHRSVNVDYTTGEDSISGIFIINNLTDRIVKVMGVDKACTCSNIELSSKEISPKQSITLKLSTIMKENEKYIDTYSVLVLDTSQKYYKFKIKGQLISP